jgi:hypothetical protein
MIDSVVCDAEERDLLERVLTWLGADVRVSCHAPLGALWVSRADWQSTRLDLLQLDAEIHEREATGNAFCLRLSGGGRDATAFFEQVLTRYQRLLPFARTPDPAVSRVLARHRALFDLSKPLVRADYDHALDTWRWSLRLDLGASSALQLAALFHDIERLSSEPEQRVEHLAADYQAFKQAHARSGALLSAQILSDCGLATAVVQRVQQLVEGHEAPGEDEDLAALNDADALSFFSLNSWGFVHYFGPDHTRAKVAYTLSRMRPIARRCLGRFRYHPVLSGLLRQELEPRAQGTAARVIEELKADA